ncbi:endolytic transglycosylase MltG [candidate division KSB1 bacterium]
MTIKTFIAIIIFLLVVFQLLQIYFFKRKQLVTGGIFLFFFWGTFGYMLFNFYIMYSSNTPKGLILEPKTIVINKGSSLSRVADQLYSEELIRNKRFFIWTANLLGMESRIKAGKYLILANLSNSDIIEQLVKGDVIQDKVTLIEGQTARIYASILSQTLEVDSTRFMDIVFDENITRKLGIDATNLEGYLFPNTYNFTWGVTEMDIVETLVSEFKKNVSDSVIAGAESLNMTLHEIVTLASIIEGEAVIDDERSMISSVYHNRLEKNMKLEADPTIQYIIPDGPRQLTNKDLQIDSPYNTYLNQGLPPGPINNPGLKSLMAAAYPATSSYLFFVAIGEGKHAFSRTYSEHLKAKETLDQLRRENRKKNSGIK